jgi:hypothetical protein
MAVLKTHAATCTRIAPPAALRTKVFTVIQTGQRFFRGRTPNDAIG